jgi:hypothetical protein
MLTHFNLFSGIGGIDIKKLLDVIADVRVKTNNTRESQQGGGAMPRRELTHFSLFSGI